MDILSDAIGGDLFTNEDKLRAMRRIDRSLSESGTFIWETFHNEVVAEVTRVTAMTPEELAEVYREDEKVYVERLTASYQRGLDRGTITQEQFDDLTGGLHDDFVKPQVLSTMQEKYGYTRSEALDLV